MNTSITKENILTLCTVFDAIDASTDGYTAPKTEFTILILRNI